MSLKQTRPGLWVCRQQLERDPRYGLAHLTLLTALLARQSYIFHRMNREESLLLCLILPWRLLPSFLLSFLTFQAFLARALKKISSTAGEFAKECKTVCLCTLVDCSALICLCVCLSVRPSVCLCMHCTVEAGGHTIYAWIKSL